MNSWKRLQKFHAHEQGFTLLELLIVIAIIGIIAGISVPVYQSFQVKNNVDLAVYELASSLRRAQILSQASDGDDTWGVYVQNGSITLFKGPNYVGRDSAYDEVFEMATSITPSGANDLTFAKVTGTPLTTGTITLTSAISTQTLVVNNKGMIEY